jgi:group I intron endonuclease
MNTIYLITNKINTKQYVGQTWSSMKHRWQQHYSPSEKSCLKLNRAIKKYGKDNLTIELITVCGMQETADYWEDFFIEKYDTIKTGYNIRKGGSRGKHSEITKRKISKSNIGKKVSEISKTKMSVAKTGINHPNYGKSLPQKTKNNISKANKGRVMSDEWKQKISVSNTGKVSPRKGRKSSPESIAKIRKTKLSQKLKSNKRFLSDNQIIYIRSNNKSSRILAKELGVSHTTIKNIRNNKIYK